MADEPTPEAPRAGAPRRASRPLILLVVAALAGAGSLAYRRFEASRPYEWSGTVEARSITVGSRTGGRVKQILVNEGDHVAAGQALIALEAGDTEAQRAQAEGQLTQVKAMLDKLEAGARPEEIAQAKARAAAASAALSEARTGGRPEDVAAAKARLDAAEATVAKADTDAQRTRKLVASGALSQADLDGAETALRTATAQRDAQKQALEALTRSRPEAVQQAVARATEMESAAKLLAEGSRVEDLAAARAQVATAKGRLDQILSAIDELTIRAPREGRVEALDLRPGDILPPNAPAATVLEDDQLYVRIYVPETRLGQIRLGQEVPVFVDSFPDKGFRGVVEHISATGEFSPRNLQTADDRADQVFATRVAIREGRDTLRAGMAAFVRVPR